MLAKYPLSDETPATSLEAPAAAPVALPGPDVAQLVHLARAVLLKSPEDLAAVATAAPSMPRDWAEAFAAERARAKAEAEFWSHALAYLMVAAPGAIANDG